MEEKYEEGYQGGQPYYLDDNTARQDEIPYTHPRRRGRRQTSQRARDNRERMLRMTAPYVFVLTVAVSITLAVCTRYLAIQSDITASKHTIKELQTSIEEMRTENDAAEESIQIYMDIDYIYDIATRELGMVYPSEDQIILYDREESEYVRQYDEIPTDD